MTTELTEFFAELAELADFGGNQVTIDSRSILGDTPLHFAVIQKNVHVVRKLLPLTRDPNVRGEYGHTPLHEAVGQNDIEIAKVLLSDPRVSLEIENDWHYTPHGLATMLKHVEITSLLEEAMQAKREPPMKRESGNQ